MPAKSKAQQALFAVAEHNPGALKGKNKRLAEMPKAKLREFAATSTKNLPEHVSKSSQGETTVRGKRK